MGNIIDYLSWRGDLSLQADGFNEVDNLVLSYLSYVNYDNEIPEPGQPFITIRELADRFFSAHSPRELSMDRTFTSDAPDLLLALSETNRFQDARIGNFVNDIDADRVLQMSAVEIRLPDGTSYVGFRGTDDRILSWKEDFLLAVGDVAAHEEAADYLKRILDENPDVEFRIGGHSKGGNLAVVASAYCGTERQKKIKEIFCNDGPGFRPEFLSSEEYRRIRDRIHRIIPRESIVGVLLEHDVEAEIIGSSARGVMQHSGTSWQVLGNRFVRERELSDFSLLFEEVMQQWMDPYDEEERVRFIDELFSVIGASGAETLTDVQSGGFSSLVSMKKRYDAMDAETKKMADELLKKVINRGGGYLSDSLLSKTEKYNEAKAHLRGIVESRSQSAWNALNTVVPGKKE